MFSCLIVVYVFIPYSITLCLLPVLWWCMYPYHMTLPLCLSPLW
jgi:hypothetical protein